MEKEIYDRMVAVIRIIECQPYDTELTKEAAEILTMIDPLIDPDILAAREICEDECGDGANNDYRNAHRDDSGVMRCALAGIKFVERTLYPIWRNCRMIGNGRLPYGT